MSWITSISEENYKCEKKKIINYIYSKNFKTVTRAFGLSSFATPEHLPSMLLFLL